jgi:uncharacterized protein YwgA
MDKMRKAVILTSLASKLREHDSWCGETHMQKSTYVLQELLGVPLDFDFILYMYGPFSFDLRSELTALRADGLLDLETTPPYGPRFSPTKQSELLRERFPKTMRRYNDRIDFVAKTFGNKKVGELERLATALYLIKKFGDSSKENQAKLMSILKPHISENEAREALEQANQIVKEAQDIING